MLESGMEVTLADLGSSLFPRDEILWNQGDVQRRDLSLYDRVDHIGNLAFQGIFTLAAGVVNFVAWPIQIVGRSISLLSPRQQPTPKPLPAPEKQRLQLEQGIVPKDVEASYQKYMDSSDASLAFPQSVKFVGIADSSQQTNGIGPDSPVPTFQKAESQWARFNHQPGTIEGIKNPDQFKSFYVDHITNPQPFIDYLKQLGANSYRFPLEWSVLQRADGSYDEAAIDLYKNFIQELKKAGIEPLVTLHHFVHPQWFEELGGFTKLENIDLFVKHATKMIELFPEVTYWMTFNELGVHSFSSYIFGSHPPGKAGRFFTAAEVLRNLCIAHCKVFKQIQDHPLPNDPQIGLTHQWLDFVPLEGKGNILERGISRLFKSHAHTALIDFLTTGKFSLDHYTFEIPEDEWKKYKGFLHFMGVQWYGHPRLKMGWNNGVPRPGYKINNFLGLTFGATCPPGGAAQAFGPSFYPASLRPTLARAAKVRKPIMITEIGGDCVNWECGKAGWESTDRSDKIRAIFSVGAIPKILQDYANSPASKDAPLIGVQYWTWIKHRQQEWDRGFGNTSLGIADVEVDEERRLVAVHDTPTSNLLAKVFRATRAQFAAAAA